MSGHYADYLNETIVDSVIEWVHEIASTKRGTAIEGLARQRLIELSEEIDRRKDLGTWVVS